MRQMLLKCFARQQKHEAFHPWTRLLVRGASIATLLGASLAPAEQLPRPVARVPLRTLGFPGYPVSLLHAGASMATVHSLDAQHVLFTYSMRALVPRLPGDDANDTDREVAAVMVEIPSGKVLARTHWRLHDHARYLWSVGSGVFVIRMGSDLSVIAPLAALGRGEDPFTRYAVPHRPGLPVLVDGSPDGKLLTLELENDDGVVMGDNEGSKRHKHYTLEFYRLNTGETPGQLKLDGAGAIGSPVLMRLPMDGDGYLWAEDDRRGKWTISFNEFGGQQQVLTPVLSSCRPRLSLLSRSQFLAETCRGSELSPMLTAFGFDGHENWQEQFGEALQPPVLALAPMAGRFAMSRLTASSNGGATVGTLVGDDPISQEIRVYQTESGDMLFRLQCTPVMRTAENFDLSPEGESLVILGKDTLDVYRLPELTAKDRKDLAEVRSMTPPEGFGPVKLTRITRPIAAPEPVGGGDATRASDEPVANPADAAPGVRAMPSTVGAVTAPSVPAGQGAVAAPVAAAAREAGPAAIAGDPGAAASGRRQPPTLLNPGEKAEFKSRPTQPH